MSARFEERAALTGAAGGTGAAVARRLTSEGATVVLLDHDLDAARAVAASVIAFLASDDARHVTGQTLAIDGGLR